jgi:hypothetical protein
MKTKKIILMALVVLGIAACKKSSDPVSFFPAELATVNTGLTLSFDTLNADVSKIAANLPPYMDDSILIRSEMAKLFTRSSFVIEFAYITPQGIMKIIEPSTYYGSQGSDISNQDHIIQAFQTKEPVLSKMFYAVEGFYAAVDIHPIVSDGQVLGGITCMFLPQTILGKIITPLVKNQAFEIWVMEKGGNVLYDQDSDEIGRNLFTDSLYTPFPELITAAHKIDTEQAGETSYSFYKTGTSIQVVKKTYWITFSLYGNEWKLIWVKPE